MKKNFFRFNTWQKRFTYAFRGLGSFFRTEHNAWIYGCCTVLLTLLAFYKGVSRAEACVLVIVTGSVWVAEMMNTAIEKLADLYSLEINPAIAIIKDVAAGAVLLSALTALVTGLIIFIPKFLC